MLNRWKTEILARFIENAAAGALKEKAVTKYLEQVSRAGKGFVPPAIFVGEGDYLLVGEIFFRFFIELGGLKRHHKVLDVGCGQGRMAIPLTGYLDQGSYDGVEIVPAGVEWGQQHFTPYYPTFRFHHADVYNKEYNPQGQTLAADYRFPFADNTFDFVFLTSVFTHLLPQDMENYFSEIRRVMKPGARCLITYFLLNEESLREMKTPPTLLTFQHEVDGFRVEDPDIPEKAIAFDESYVKSLYGKYGLEIVGPIHYGSWCGRPNYTWVGAPRYLTAQDLIVATKR